MTEEICPFYQKKCLEKRCKFWGVENCLIIEQLTKLPVLKAAMISKSSEGVQSPESLWDDDHDDASQPFTNPEPEKRKKIKGKSKEEKLLELMDPQPMDDREHGIPKYLKKPVKELARDLADFCLKKKPNANRWLDLHRIRDLFWESHDIKSYLVPPEYRIKMEEVEDLSKKMVIEKKIPVFLRNNTIEELVTEMMKNLTKFDSGSIRNYWNEERLNGLEIHDLPQELQKKIEDANNRVEELREEEKSKQMRNRVNELVPELIEWCKSKNLSRITSTDVHAFMFEKNMSLSWDAISFLEFTAIQQYRKNPKKKRNNN